MKTDNYQFEVKVIPSGIKVKSTYSHTEQTLLMTKREAFTLAKKILIALNPSVKSIKVFNESL